MYRNYEMPDFIPFQCPIMCPMMMYRAEDPEIERGIKKQKTDNA